VARLIAQSVRHEPASKHGALRGGLAIGLLGFFLHSLLEQTFFEAVTAPFWWIALGLLTGASRLRRSGEGAPAPGGNRVTSVVLPFALAAALVPLVSRSAIADGWAARGAFLDLANRPEEAASAFAQAQRWDPLASRYPLEQGERLVTRAAGSERADAARWLRDAQRQFGRAVHLSPRFGVAWLKLGQVSWRLGQRDEAIRAMRQAVRWDPNSRAAAAPGRRPSRPRRLSHASREASAWLRFMLINLLPEFFAVLDSADPVEAYQHYFHAHRALLEAYWHNFVIEPAGPHFDDVVRDTLRAERGDLRAMLDRTDVAALARDTEEQCASFFEVDSTIDVVLMVGVGAANAGELVVEGRGIAFACLEHFTSVANPSTRGLGLDPELLPMWLVHEIAHCVRYTSPASRSDSRSLAFFRSEMNPIER